MYTKTTSVPLLIVEYLNIAVTIVFLLLFIKRFRQLKPYSATYSFSRTLIPYPDHFPKLCAVFSIAYVVFSLTLLTYNLSTESYSPDCWYQYLLQGGGGECIDSLILMFQLGVLRYQINKQQPYTKYHFFLFLYVIIIEVVRFTLTLIDVTDKQNDDPTLIICSLMFADAIIIFFYWKKIRKSLPQFIDPTTDVEIDDLNYHTRVIQSRNQRNEKSIYVRGNKQFPYIIPFVCYENGKFKIALERVTYNQVYRSTNTSERQRKASQLPQIQSSLLTNHNYIQKKMSSDHEYLGSQLFTLQQMQRMYTICGKYFLKKEIDFQNNNISNLVHEIQDLLNNMFAQENKYDPQLLLFLNVPFEVIREYEDFLLKIEAKDSEIDRVLGIPFPEDKNATYVSVVGYKTLWLGDHFKYYFKILTKMGETTYLIKQTHQIDEFYFIIKRGIKMQTKRIQIPQLLKMSSIQNNKEESLRVLEYYESLLSTICNDFFVMSNQTTNQIVKEFLQVDTPDPIEPQFSKQFFCDLRIVPKACSFSLRNQESTLMYEFKLIKKGEVIKTIARDQQSVMNLHDEMTRWLKNSQNPSKILMPFERKEKNELILFKINKFLQDVLSFRQIHKLYAVTTFFDVHHINRSLNCFRNRRKTEDGLERTSFTTQQSSITNRTEIQNMPQPTYFSNRISDILDDLGNQSLD